MSHMKDELHLTGEELRNNPDGPKYEQLYAAQQALSWATDPERFRSPYRMIMDIPAETEGCPGCPDPGPS